MRVILAIHPYVILVQLYLLGLCLFFFHLLFLLDSREILILLWSIVSHLKITTRKKLIFKKNIPFLSLRHQILLNVLLTDTNCRARATKLFSVF